MITILAAFCMSSCDNGANVPVFEESSLSYSESMTVSQESSDIPVEQSADDSAPDEISEEAISEPDYLPEVYYNISAKKHYTVSTPKYRSDGFGDFDDAEGTSPRYKLTDGLTADSGSSEKIGGYEANKISVVIDLGELCYVTSISNDVFGGHWGISDPSEIQITYYLMPDSSRINEIATVSPSLGNAYVSEKNGWRFSQFNVNANKAKARYVRLDITSPDHIWMSEITVMGRSADNSSRGGNIGRIYIETLDNDRVHRSSYHQCKVTVYDPSGTFDTIIDPNAQIKIRGNSTSSGEKQPYNIKFEQKQNVFGLGKCKKWYLLANMYDKTQLRNKLSFSLAQDIGMDYVQNSTFAELYLNGEYRGMYQLCESIGVGDSRVDIDVTGNEFLLEFEPWPQYANEEWFTTPRYGIVFGFNDPGAPTEEQREYLQDFFTKAEAAISSRKYEEIIKYLDIESFIDAFVVQEYFKQVDYATSSTRFYIKDNMLYEGPVWDFDLSSGNCSSDYYKSYNNVDTTGISWQGDHCYGIYNRRLLECPEILEMFKTRYKELQPYIVNIYEDNELGQNRIDALLDKFRESIDLNYTMWSTSVAYSILEKLPEDGTYDAEIDYLRDWLKNRNLWMLDRYGIE